MERKKFDIIDFLIVVLVTLILSSFVIPHGINYILSIRNRIPSNVKQEILIAGKKYLENNNVISVSLDELTKYGYINESDIENSNCFTTITTVTRDFENKYYLDLKCIDDSSTLTLLE